MSNVTVLGHPHDSVVAEQPSSRRGTPSRRGRSETPRPAAELLRSDHIVILLVDAVAAMHAAFRDWRLRRRTRRALARLDDRQLRDIGLVRGDIDVGPDGWWWARERSYRGFIALDGDAADRHNR